LESDNDHLDFLESDSQNKKRQTDKRKQKKAFIEMILRRVPLREVWAGRWGAPILKKNKIIGYGDSSLLWWVAYDIIENGGADGGATVLDEYTDSVKEENIRYSNLSQRDVMVDFQVSDYKRLLQALCVKLGLPDSPLGSYNQFTRLSSFTGAADEDFRAVDYFERMAKNTFVSWSKAQQRAKTSIVPASLISPEYFDPYKILGISQEELRRSDEPRRLLKERYRDKMRAVHPDRNPDNPNAAFVSSQMARALEMLEAEIEKNAANFVGSIEKRSVRHSLLRRIMGSA
jgi:hypothetical protein